MTVEPEAGMVNELASVENASTPFVPAGPAAPDGLAFSPDPNTVPGVALPVGPSLRKVTTPPELAVATNVPAVAMANDCPTETHDAFAKATLVNPATAGTVNDDVVVV